jgi:hypothetical protein
MQKMKKTSEKETTVNGFVEETELDNGDTGIQLVGEDYNYQVVMDRQGKKLLNYIDEEVTATGVVGKVKGERHITISHFQVLDDYEDEEEEDDDYYDDDEQDDYFDDRIDD